jgi:hypothetical protein
VRAEDLKRGLFTDSLDEEEEGKSGDGVGEPAPASDFVYDEQIGDADRSRIANPATAGGGEPLSAPGDAEEEDDAELTALLKSGSPRWRAAPPHEGEEEEEEEEMEPPSPGSQLPGSDQRERQGTDPWELAFDHEESQGDDSREFAADQGGLQGTDSRALAADKGGLRGTDSRELASDQGGLQGDDSRELASDQGGLQGADPQAPGSDQKKLQGIDSRALASDQEESQGDDSRTLVSDQKETQGSDSRGPASDDEKAAPASVGDARAAETSGDIEALAISAPVDGTEGSIEEAGNSPEEALDGSELPRLSELGSEVSQEIGSSTIARLLNEEEEDDWIGTECDLKTRSIVLDAADEGNGQLGLFLEEIAELAPPDPGDKSGDHGYLLSRVVGLTIDKVEVVPVVVCFDVADIILADALDAVLGIGKIE